MPPVSIRLARHAMATRFELALHGENEPALRAAGEEALEEVDRLEAQLSLFCPTSEIADLNRRAHRVPVQVSPPVFALLEHARALWEETAGAFDITIAPLLRAWGFLGGTGRMPEPQQGEEARREIGMDLVRLDRENRTVQFTRPGVMVDLGAIGKGYAVEQACAILREAGVTSALLHGGTSTIGAIGAPPGETAWKIAVDPPPPAPGPPTSQSADTTQPLATFQLKDEALSVSAVWGKCFTADERRHGHVLDPRTGHPTRGTLLAAVVLPSATETDALSTALLVSGASRQEHISSLRPGMRTLVVSEASTGYRVQAFPPFR